MTDLDIIRQIEKELNVKLDKLNEIEYGSQVYVLNRSGQLTGLGLCQCNIKNLDRIGSQLQELTNLIELYLSDNQLSDISPLKGLTNLMKLNLSDNQLSDISPLKKLTNLMELNLRQNQLRDISSLRGLTNLTELNLKGNQLSDISPLKELTNLTKLYLNYNQLTEISPLKDLLKLTVLYLQENRISDISALKKLTQLNFLWLWGNQINDISPIKMLKKLAELGLNSNKIEKLPVWITDFNLDILYNEEGNDGKIHIGNNPLKFPPVEIVKQGKKAIINYFRSLEGKKRVKLNEVKVLLVGEGMSGKTSLLKQFQGLSFDKDESQTHGINVISLPAKAIKGFVDTNGVKDFRIHFWDFGGQEIMHASHQFFMSKRSLYILVLDSRTDSKKYHWLKHIEKFGGDSPLIVVMNKIDANPNYNIEQKRINESFPHIKNRFHRISCQTQEGLPELVTYLAKAIPQTSLFGTEISIDWMNIKEKLVEETKANRYISRERFVEICQDNDVNDQSSQQTLLQYLNDLGVVLYFKQLNLANIYVLDPHWVTIGAYKIINSEQTKDGILKEEDLEYILNQEEIKKHEYDPAREKKIFYSPEEQRYILSIMMQFELCYEYDKRKNHYIIPDLLPKELNNEPELSQGTPLRFVMTYDYLPVTIISRLMLRLKNDIVDGQQWKYGMILDNKEFGCQAKIKEDEPNKRIDITVQGEFLCKRQYFSAIRHNIYDINKDFENLEVQEFIPLPGYPDLLVEYKELLGYERAGRDEYFVGKLGKSFSVSDMLDSVISKAERVKQYQSYPAHDLEETIERRFDQLNDKFDNTTQSILNKIEKENRSAVSVILSKLDESEKRVVDFIFEKIKENKIPEMEIYEVLLGIKQGIELINAKKIKGNDVDKIKRIDNKINETSDLKSKFKLTIPIIPLFFRFEQEIDVSESLRKFWEKWKDCVI